MSLRDQLLKKGLASKKDLRRVNQQSKKKRKKQQGAKRKNSVVEREEQAARQAREERERQERLEARQKAEAVRDRYERALQIRNVLLGNRVQGRGDHPFFVKGPDGRKLQRLGVKRAVAEKLSSGALAVAALDLGNRHELVLIGAEAARKLTELGAGGLILHWARGEAEPGDGLLLDRDWEPSLVPHRVRHERP